MTYKILHFSDLHLDTSFAGQGFSLEYGVERRLGLRACLTRIMARARDLKVDAITIGGDLYDQEYLLPETADFIQQQFTLLAPIRVIITPGEKDPYTSDSAYARLNWSDNVDIFYQRKLTCLDLSTDVHFWGTCPPFSNNRKLFNDYTPANGVNLLLLHGPRKLILNDIFANRNEVPKNASFDLVLIGGEHILDFGPSEHPFYLYPGSPEPLNPSEGNGIHQVILVEIDGRNIRTQSFELQQWNYSVVQVDITKYSSNTETARQISNLIEKEIKKVPQSAITVKLTGSPQFDLNLSTIRQLIQSGTFFCLECHFSMSHNIEQLAKEQTVRGFLVQRFLERINKAANESERNRELTALNIALQALEGKQVGLYEVKSN